MNILSNFTNIQLNPTSGFYLSKDFKHIIFEMNKNICLLLILYDFIFVEIIQLYHSSLSRIIDEKHQSI